MELLEGVRNVCTKTAHSAVFLDIEMMKQHYVTAPRQNGSSYGYPVPAANSGDYRCYRYLPRFCALRFDCLLFVPPAEKTSSASYFVWLMFLDATRAANSCGHQERNDAIGVHRPHRHDCHLLLIVDHESTRFTVRGPPSDSLPWIRQVECARSAGRQIDFRVVRKLQAEIVTGGGRIWSMRNGRPAPGVRKLTLRVVIPDNADSRAAIHSA